MHHSQRHHDHDLDLHDQGRHDLNRDGRRSAVCPACHADVGRGTSRCKACGTPISLLCPSCGRSTSPGSKFCSACGHQLLADDAERRQLTVMFCDLVGYSELVSRRDPEDVREIVGSFLRRVTEVVAVFNGFVAEYLGDGALVYFGYPTAHENDVECAVRAGLQVVEEVSRLTLLGGYRPRVRIGIATGLVVVGATEGTGIAAIRNAAGASPSLAARLQALAEPGTVVVAPSTRQLAGGLFEYRDLGPALLKGFSEPVRAWQVLGAASTDSRFEARHQSALTPLVGREEEVALLWDAWRHAREGSGRVVLLSGEPGIGKSRLTAILLDRVAAEPHTRLRYFCSPHLQGSPLHPCIQQLERAAGFVRGDSPERKLELLEATLAAGAVDDSDVALIADLLSLPSGDRYPKPQITAQKRKERTMEALLRQLEALSRRQPVLMIFEDVHWIDPTSLDLLDLTVARVADRPILLIVTSRPEFSTTWDSQPHVSVLSLRSLARQESATLIANVAGTDTLPNQVVDDILERTDGVPLYLEELTNAVLEASLEQGGARSVAARAPGRELVVPATLHASLMTRLDRLGEAKEIAQMGAALGREFSYELLAAVAGRHPAELEAALERLINAGLLFASGTPPQVAYLFKHALVQDAAYDTMLRAKRQKLHQRIVQVLEEAFPETKDVQPELVAHHCTEAGLTDKAIGYWLQAGVRALSRSTMQEALGRLQQGLKLIATLPENAARHRLELSFQIARGKALIATKGYAVQVTGDTFARAHDLCAALNHPPQLLSVLHGQWTHALLRGDMVSAQRRTEELVQQGHARGDEVWMLMGCRFAGVTCYPIGEFAAGRDHLQRGLSLFDPARRTVYAAVTVDDAQVVMLTYLAYQLLYLGDVDQARRRCEEALEEARRLAQPYSLTHALIGAAYVSYYLGDVDNAMKHLAKLLALTAEHGIAYYGAIGTIFLGCCLAATERVEEGIRALEQGLEASRATGSALYLPSWLTMLANAHGKAERPERGLELVTEALQVLQVTGMRNDESEVHRVRGELLLASGDRHGAEASFLQALHVAQRQQAMLLALRAATLLARLWTDRGDRPRSRALLIPVYERIREGFDVPAVRHARALLHALA
jgi:class 3 adenylate cyclase/predicted ATPase